MTKKKKLKTKALAKPLTTDEVSQVLQNLLDTNNQQKQATKDLQEQLAKLHAKQSDEENRQAINKNLEKLFRLREQESQFELMNAFIERQQPVVKEMALRTAEEYGCQTQLEKSLATTVAHAYMRYVDCSRRLKNELECENITSNRNRYIEIMSKQVDRAHRQYLSSIQSLKLLKAPAVNMKVNVDTAYMANQQQFNATKEHDSNTTT